MTQTQIVPNESACIPGYEKLSIHADHTAMCKISDKNDANYHTVSEVFKRWAQSIRDSRKPMLAEEDVGLSSLNLSIY